MDFKKGRNSILDLARKVFGLENERYRAFSLGFHGDQYLLTLANTLLERSINFIETGANVGSTLAYVARSHPRVNCFSCEPDGQAFRLAQDRTRALSNVAIFNLSSQHFMEQISSWGSEFHAQMALFWLDAHSYGFEWPLAQEVSFITRTFERGYLLIDDFKVPGQKQFHFHQSDGNECSFDYVRSFLNRRQRYALYYPTYAERTSNHHPLIGWGLIAFGDVIQLELAELEPLKIRRAPVQLSGEQAWKR